MGISRLLRKPHTDKTTCTIDWLAKYHYRQFGRKMIASILDAAGVMPLYRTKNTQNSEFTPIYNLEQCIAAIDEYQKALNEQTRRKKNKRKESKEHGVLFEISRQIMKEGIKKISEKLQNMDLDSPEGQKEVAQEIAMLTAKAKDMDNA